jgi:uncharacterized membrane protein
MTLAAILGVGYVLLMPPFQAPDESEHFLRAYEVSQGHFVSAGTAFTPVQIGDFVQMFPPRLLSATGERDMLRKTELTALLHQRLDESNVHQKERPISANIYPFIPYLPASLAIRTGLIWHASPLLLLYLGRLATFSLFLVSAFVTIRILPAGGLAIACLALMPMTLHQAAAVSADGVAFSSAFLLCAYTLQIALDESGSRVSTGQYLVFGGLILVSALSKSNPWMPLVLAVIPAKKFGLHRKWQAVTLACLIGLAGAAAWQYVNRDNVERFVKMRAERGIDAATNARAIMRHPVGTAATIVQTLGYGKAQIADQFVGELGWLDISLPKWLIWGYIALLLLASTQSAARLQPWQRSWLMFLFLSSALTTFVWLAVIDMPEAYRQAMVSGKFIINSMQGRYLIPIAPLFLMAVSGLPRPRFSRRLAYVCLAVATMASLVAFTFVWRAYYAPKSGGQGTETERNRISLGVYQQGRWILNSYTGRGQQTIEPGGYLAGDIPVTGDWNGDGRGKLGIFRNGRWTLDSNGDQKLDDRDVSFYFGGIADDVPVTGDWNGDGKTKVGIYRRGIWILDVNGGRSENGVKVFAFGGTPEDIPVVGDWNGDGKSKVGVYRKGLWVVDYAGHESEKDDKVIPYGGIPGDVPISGDWSGEGKCRFGIYRHGTWILDTNGDYRMDGNDRVFAFDAEMKGAIPVVLHGGGTPAVSAPASLAEKQAPPSAAALLWVHDSKEHNQQSDGPRRPSSSDFETFHVTFIATETRTVRVHLHRAPGEGSILWDNVRVVSSKGEQLPTLRNPDFEGGGLAPWMYYGKVAWNLMPLAANGGRTVVREHSGDGGVCQDVTGLITGQTYQISALMKWVRE